MQLKLFTKAAEKNRKITDGEADSGVPLSATRAGAKKVNKQRKALPALVMEEVANEVNLKEACKKVVSNKGAPGPDRQSVKEVERNFLKLLPYLSQALIEGTYKPGEVRRAWIPKGQGGQRGLGIPNVIDRIVQQAVLQVLQPHYDPTFDESSHGFRPKKSCHTAIEEAKKYVEEGYEWVVDIDLEKFFDTVNHQRLLDRLRQKIEDKRLLELIRRMLKAKTIMPDGVIVSSEEGTPQGGPLSPLLSNIVLSELDEKLRERGHKFVRYADDCNIYVHSEKSGRRVLESTKRFIEKRLRLKVNSTKSAVAKPVERHFLGFSLESNLEQGTVEIRLSKRSKERIYARIKELTPRTWGRSLDDCIQKLNAYLNGWIEFFKICVEESILRTIDAHIRRRLRAIQLKQWKRKRIIVQNLIKMGASPKDAWRGIYKDKRSLWKLSHCEIVDRTLRNVYFIKRGLVSIFSKWKEKKPSTTNVQMQFAFG